MKKMNSTHFFKISFYVSAILVTIIVIFLVSVIRNEKLYRELDRLAEPDNFYALKNYIDANPDIIKRKLNLPNGDGNISIVHLVCSYHNLEGINYLKKCGADFSLETKFGNTPLIILSRFFNPKGIQCIRSVIESKNLEPSSIILPNKFGNSAILISIKYRQKAYLEEYMSIAVQSNIEYNKNNLLQFAIEKLPEADECVEIIQVLLAGGANPTIKNQFGESSLDLAKKGGKIKFLEALSGKP